MKHAKRGRGSRRGVYLCSVVALGLALSACGGGASSPVGAAAAQGSQPTQGSVASDSPASAQGSTSGEDTTSGNPPTATIGAVTINWMPPTENTNGSALTNLAGYHIHYGTASGRYTQTISVSNAGLATYVVSDLTPGKYYFAVAAVNSAGTESPLSSEVSATVN